MALPIVGKNTWDIMRSVDFLQALDFVDPDQIGCIGLPVGGNDHVVQQRDRLK